MVRRSLPLGPPSFLLALLAGAVFGGWDAGWSAAIGVAIVFTNFVVHGLSLARAAKISLTALAATALIGFVLRLAIIFAIMVALDRLAFFSPLAFGLAVVPATLLLLGFELKLLAGGVGQELSLPADPPAAARKPVAP